MEDYCHYIKLPACVENNNEACTSDAGKPTRKWQQKLQRGSTEGRKVENLNSEIILDSQPRFSIEKGRLANRSKLSENLC